MTAAETLPLERRPDNVPDVSVVIVSYNTRELLEACLRSVLKSTGVSVELFVVDNGSHDGSADLVATAFADVRLIRNTENRGFAAANNLAIAHARGRYLLLLNPDTIVRPNTFAVMAAFLDACTDVGITGPRVLNPDGSVQSCGYWYPTLREEILLSRNVRKVARLVLGEVRADPNPTREFDVDWVDGCCLMIRHALVQQIGMLDEQYFLYAEELDWCRTTRGAGWRIVTCPQAEMIHLRGKSSELVKAPALAMLIETRLRYYRKHDGLFQAMLVSAVYVLGCLRRWHAEPHESRAKLRGVGHWLHALVGGADAHISSLAVASPTDDIRIREQV